MVTRLNKKPPNFLIALFVLLILPVFLHGNARIMNNLILSIMWGVVASAWNLIMGYARVFSLGQIAFFAIGGYTSAMLTMQLGISPWLGVLAGGALAVAIGILIGLLCLRLRGIYVAVVTLAIQLTMPTLIQYGGPFATGSSTGLVGIPFPQLGGYILSPDALVPWYYVALGISAPLLFAIYKIINSRIGLAFMALRDSEPFAKSLGVDERRYTLIVFGISSFIAGLMGALHTHYMSLISPRILGLDTFLLCLIMVMLGGLGRFPGAVIGAFAIIFANDFLLVTGLFRLAILGAIVIAAMISLPQGLMGFPEAANRLIRRIFKGKLKKPQN